MNINDVIEFFFHGEFPSFCKHMKGHQHQQILFYFILNFIFIFK